MKRKLLAAAFLFFFVSVQLHALTLEEERKYGREIFVEIARGTKPYTDPYLPIQLSLIKDRIEASTALPFPIKLTVIDAYSMDAFATMGGYVYVTNGLISACDREDEIAGVLSHEFGHVGRFHVSKRIEKEKTLSIARLAALFLSMVIPNPAVSGAVLSTGMAGAQTASLKYSREDENEADSTGVGIAERAGYSGVGTAEFLKKLRLTGLEKTLPQYLLTHPYSDERIGRVEALATTRKTSVDTSLFPFIIARMTIVDRPFGPEVEDQWARRYARNPEDPVNIYGMALVLTSKGNSEQAIKTVQTINSPHKALFLGEIMVSARRWGDAIRTLENESNPIALFFLARAYEGAGDVARAARILEGLRSYAGTYPEIYQRLGMVLGRQGNEAGGYENLGRYYLGTGKEQQAGTYLEKAIAKYGLNSAKGQELMALLDSFKKDPSKK